MNAKQGIILLVSERNEVNGHSVELIIRAGSFMLKLSIEPTSVQDLLHEFDIRTPMEAAGKEIIIDLESGILSRKRGVNFETKDSIYVKSKISFPT